MKKLTGTIILLLAPLFPNTAALAHDLDYYRLHPVDLQQALDQCPGKHPAGISCEQLDECATRANELVSELHHSPQGFGKKILALQESVAAVVAELKSQPHRTRLKASLEKDKMQLRERLAIVKWLESPRG